MKANSTKKHSQLPKHIENYNIWLAQKATAEVATADSHKNVEDESNSSSQDDQVSYIGDIGDVEMDDDIEERQKELIDLWTKDYTNIFNTPVHSPNISVATSPVASVHGSEDIGDDGNQSDGDNQFGHEDTVDQDESSWAPFSGLEARLYF